MSHNVEKYRYQSKIKGKFKENLVILGYVFFTKTVHLDFFISNLKTRLDSEPNEFINNHKFLYFQNFAFLHIPALFLFVILIAAKSYGKSYGKTNPMCATAMN